MNFIEQQKYHKKQSLKLRMLFVVAVLFFIVLINIAVQVLSLLFVTEVSISSKLIIVTTTIVTLILIACGVYKYKQLHYDSSRIVKNIGGILLRPGISDPPKRQLINIVEEMSIASGIPVPQVFLLDKEVGINAFVTGENSSTAILVVTRGAIEKLDRDELQGVLAHEFSHIQNADIQLNTRLISYVHGLLCVSQIGKSLMRVILPKFDYKAFIIMFVTVSPMFYIAHVVSATGGTGVIFGLPQIWMTGAIIFLFGGLGLIFSRVIKSLLNRQREYLADATAIEFTRHSSGLKYALAKISVDEAYSYIKNGNIEEVSHMLFASGKTSFMGLLNTHPPLSERILKLDPEFDFRELGLLKEKIKQIEINTLREKIKQNAAH